MSLQTRLDALISAIGADVKALYAAPGRPTLSLAADQAISSVNFTDITGLSVNMLANTSYEIEGTLYWTVAAATTGWRWGIVGPGLALASIESAYLATATTEAVLSQQHSNTTLTPSMVVQSASPFAVVPNILRFRGYVRNGATAGALKAQFASETNGTAVTVLKGSYMSYKQF